MEEAIGIPEPRNIFGAIIFWSYIVAALAFTGIVLDTIFKLPKPTGLFKHHALTFLIFAIFSFSILSANMVNFLILSYKAWAAQRFQGQNVLDTLSISNIWDWSINSRLFREFGEAIVKDDVRFLWTQSALLATFSVCLFMGAEGLQRRVPRLWAFFALSQILPISFAQNLFYIALLRSPNKNGNEVVFSRNLTIRITAVYCICLMVAPYTAQGLYLIPTILAARSLLFLPLILPKENDQSVTRPFTHRSAQSVLATLAAGMTVYRAYLVFNRGVPVVDAWKVMFSHPAVQTLGWDFLVCSVSFGIWIMYQYPRQGVDRTKTVP